MEVFHLISAPDLRSFITLLFFSVRNCRALGELRPIASLESGTGDETALVLPEQSRDAGVIEPKDRVLNGPFRNRLASVFGK